MDLTASMEERYLAMLRLAAGEITEDDFVAWLRANTAPMDAKA
jgi:prophage maintenance system killer protein